MSATFYDSRKKNSWIQSGKKEINPENILIGIKTTAVVVSPQSISPISRSLKAIGNKSASCKSKHMFISLQYQLLPQCR